MKDYKNINEYIQDADKSSQKYLREMRKIVQELVPKGEEVIRYGMPTLQIDGQNILHYAAMKGHFGFYPTPSAINIFSKDLEKAGFGYSKGCIRFPWNKPLPTALIKKIVKFRLREKNKISR